MTNKITNVTALNTAIEALSAEEYAEVVERLSAMRDSLVARSNARKSDESRAKANAHRKEKVVAERKAIVDVVAPIIRKAMGQDSLTAKDIFARCEGLPVDFTANKVQYVLLHEMANEVVKTETKGQANTYTLA